MFLALTLTADSDHETTGPQVNVGVRTGVWSSAGVGGLWFGKEVSAGRSGLV